VSEIVVRYDAHQRLREAILSSPLPEMVKPMVLAQLGPLFGGPEETIVEIARQVARAASYVAGDPLEGE
jgi:hypothetical protein